MSVASLAIQIRASMACKLGSPITLLPPPRPAIPTHVPDQILALPSGSGHSAAGLRSKSPRYVGRELRYLHFHESRRRVFPQSFFPPVEMRRAQPPLSAELRHTRSAPHLFGNQSASLRPRISVSFSLRHGRNCATRRPSSARCGSRSAHITARVISKSIFSSHFYESLPCSVLEELRSGAK